MGDVVGVFDQVEQVDDTSPAGDLLLQRGRVTGSGALAIGGTLIHGSPFLLVIFTIAVSRRSSSNVASPGSTPRTSFRHLQHRDVRISCCSRSSLRDALPAETSNRGAGLEEDGSGREGGTGTG
jgi:hypothetical protein